MKISAIIPTLAFASLTWAQGPWRGLAKASLGAIRGAASTINAPPPQSPLFPSPSQMPSANDARAPSNTATPSNTSCNPQIFIIMPPASGQKPSIRKGTNPRPKAIDRLKRDIQQQMATLAKMKALEIVQNVQGNLPADKSPSTSRGIPLGILQ